MKPVLFLKSVKIIIFRDYNGETYIRNSFYTGNHTEYVAVLV